MAPKLWKYGNNGESVSFEIFSSTLKWSAMIWWDTSKVHGCGHLMQWSLGWHQLLGAASHHSCGDCTQEATAWDGEIDHLASPNTLFLKYEQQYQKTSFLVPNRTTANTCLADGSQPLTLFFSFQNYVCCYIPSKPSILVTLFIAKLRYSNFFRRPTFSAKERVFQQTKFSSLWKTSLVWQNGTVWASNQTSRKQWSGFSVFVHLHSFRFSTSFGFRDCHNGPNAGSRRQWSAFLTTKKVLQYDACAVKSDFCSLQPVFPALKAFQKSPCTLLWQITVFWRLSTTNSNTFIPGAENSHEVKTDLHLQRPKFLRLPAGFRKPFKLTETWGFADRFLKISRSYSSGNLNYSNFPCAEPIGQLCCLAPYTESL